MKSKSLMDQLKETAANQRVFKSRHLLALKNHELRRMTVHLFAMSKYFSERGDSLISRALYQEYLEIDNVLELRKRK